MINRSIRSAGLLLTVLVLAAVAPPQALAQDNYPNRPIRIISPTAAGGGAEAVLRLLGQALSERLGRQVVLEHRPGASTIIGTELVAKAVPDGHTLLAAVAALGINPATYKKLPYDALRDFAPITQVLFVANMIAVHPSVPARSAKEFIALARARPGEILFAASGYGTNSHLAVELFASMAQIRMVLVPYKGSTPGIIDTIAGHVPLTAASLPSLLPHVRSGKLRALGVGSARRVTVAPGIPTIAEAGVPGYESVQWSGLLAPAATPREIIARLYRELVAVLRAPENREAIGADGSEVVGSSPEEFAAFLKADIAKWTVVVKAAGIKPQ